VQQLPRRLGMWSLVAVTMGLLIGSGIFRTPATIADLVGSAPAIAAVWVLGGLATLCLALCLAELGAMFPQAGGAYIYLREAFGPASAFAYGWTYLIVTPSSWAAITLIFAEYLGQFLPLSQTDKRIAATAVLLFVTTASYVSLTFATAIQGVATSAKTFALAGIAVVLFALGDGATGAFAQPAVSGSLTFGAFIVALVAVLWPYEGVVASCAMAGEIRDPQRNVPRALIISVVGVMALYLLINAAYLYVLPVATVASSGLVAADAMQRVTGGAGAAVIAACVMLATFGTVSASAIADPRVFYAMAVDGLFFRRIGLVHPRFQTPHIAVAVCGALSVLYIWVSTFEALAAQFILGVWPLYALTVAGLIWLRRRRPDADRPYRAPLYPLVPIVFLLAATALLVGSMVELPIVSLINFAIIGASYPVYLLWRRAAARAIVPARDVSPEHAGRG
jgi:APA family basic amino acid/polyamine antiporter